MYKGTRKNLIDVQPALELHVLVMSTPLVKSLTNQFRPCPRFTHKNTEIPEHRNTEVLFSGEVEYACCMMCDLNELLVWDEVYYVQLCTKALLKMKQVKFCALNGEKCESEKVCHRRRVAHPTNFDN